MLLYMQSTGKLRIRTASELNKTHDEEILPDSNVANESIKDEPDIQCKKESIEILDSENAEKSTIENRQNESDKNDSSTDVPSNQSVIADVIQKKDRKSKINFYCPKCNKQQLGKLSLERRVECRSCSTTLLYQCIECRKIFAGYYFANQHANNICTTLTSPLTFIKPLYLTRFYNNPSTSTGSQLQSLPTIGSPTIAKIRLQNPSSNSSQFKNLPTINLSTTPFVSPRPSQPATSNLPSASIASPRVQNITTINAPSSTSSRRPSVPTATALASTSESTNRANLRSRQLIKSCNWCQKRFKHIIKHKYSCPDRPVFACPHCAVKRTSIENLAFHIRTYHA